MKAFQLPARRIVHQLFLVVSALIMVVLIGFALFNVYFGADDFILMGVRSLGACSALIVLASLILSQYRLTAQSIQMQNQLLIVKTKFLLWKKTKNISLENLQSISVQRKKRLSDLSKWQNIALTQFADMSLSFKNSTSMNILNGYSIIQLNELAKKLYVSLPLLKQRECTLVTEETSLAVQLSSEVNPLGSFTPQCPPQFEFSCGSRFNHFAVKSLFLSLTLFLFAAPMWYFDHYPTAAMMKAGTDKPSFFLALTYNTIFISSICFFLLFIYYSCIKITPRIIKFDHSTITLFSDFPKNYFKQFKKADIAVSFVDEHTILLRNKTGYELIIMDHALNPSVLLLDGSFDEANQAALLINSWLLT